MFNTNLRKLSLLAFALTGWIVAAPQDWTKTDEPKVATDEGAAPLDALTFVRGMEVPVGSARTLAGTTPKTVMVDTYLDWDFGTLTYVGEDGSMAAVPAPKNWEFRHVQLPRSESSGGGMVALCFQPGTGLTFLLDGDGKWMPIEEPTSELVVGDYDVTLALDVDRIFAVRFDQFSGRSWTLEDSGWRPIAGNLKGWPEATSGEGR
jgi:hypothetical protein